MKRYHNSAESKTFPLLQRGSHRFEGAAKISQCSREAFYDKMYCDFNALVENALHSISDSAVDRRAARLIAGFDKRRPLPSLTSHMPTRRHCAQILYEQLAPLFEADPSRSWFFGTFITDLGNSLEYAPVLERGRLHRDVRKMLDLVGMHAIGVIELQLARFPLVSAGRTVEAHVHTIGYVDDSAVRPDDLQRTIAARGTLHNWLNAPVAVFRPIITNDNLAARCEYLFKPPLYESWLSSDRFKRSGFKTHSDATVDCWGALRLVELLSRVTLRESLLARGDLVIPKGDVIRAVNDWAARRPAPELPDCAALFERLWGRAPTRRLRAVPSIRHDASHPLDPAWTDAMAKRMTEVAANQLRYEAYQSSRRR